MKKYKEGDVNQLWGYTNTGRWYAYDNDGFIVEVLKSENKNRTTQEEYKNYIPYVIDQAACDVDGISIVVEGTAKQQMWHIEWVA